MTLWTPFQRRWRIKPLILILWLVTGHSVSTVGQAFNCKIEINYEQITSVNQEVFNKMSMAFNEFFNNQTWTEDKFEPEERINCSMLLTLTDAPTNSLFKGTLSVQATRPVYNTSYETLVFSFVDNNLFFDYQEDQPIYYNENGFTSNITSIFAFYAYVILGYDYNSFGKNDGNKFFDKANEVVSYAQQSSLKDGWNIDFKNSRYELIQELTNPQFASFNEDLYKYHLESLDIMHKDLETPRKNILEVIRNHEKVMNLKQQPLILRAFYMAKVQELINLYSRADKDQKDDFIELMEKLDAGNLARYQKVYDSF